jgi:glyoxylase-like metal-dependent hydrolase (beta-lactamase superfamily II)
MKIEQIIVGPLESNCFIVFDEQKHQALIVDPGAEPDKILRFIEAGKLDVNYIVCTHAHFDHVGAVAAIREKTAASIVLHKLEREIYAGVKDQGALWGFTVEQPPQPDKLVEEGDTLRVGDLEFTVLHTPGHSPGGICLYGAGVLISGDSIFAGSVGRTDFFGGSIEALKGSFKRIISLPPDTKILPGHGEQTTVGIEKEMNFFVHEL